jgi:hypothetical protein
MIKVIKRALKEQEINILMSDIRYYPSLIYVKKSRLAKYKAPYVIEDEGEFVGMCAVYEFANWIKLGPLVFLKQSHDLTVGGFN